MVALFPASVPEAPKGAAFPSDPQALSPLSLPHARQGALCRVPRSWACSATTGAASFTPAGRASASHRARVPCLSHPPNPYRVGGRAEIRTASLSAARARAIDARGTPRGAALSFPNDNLAARVIRQARHPATTPAALGRLARASLPRFSLPLPIPFLAGTAGL